MSTTRTYSHELTDDDLRALRAAANQGKPADRQLSVEAVEAMQAHDRALALGATPMPLRLPEEDVRKLRALAAEVRADDEQYADGFRSRFGREPRL